MFARLIAVALLATVPAAAHAEEVAAPWPIDVAGVTADCLGQVWGDQVHVAGDERVAAIVIDHEAAVVISRQNPAPAAGQAYAWIDDDPGFPRMTLIGSTRPGLSGEAQDFIESCYRREYRRLLTKERP